MSVIKRVIAKRKQEKRRVWIQIVFYAVLLFGMFGCALIYTNVKEEVKKTEKSIYRTVLLRKVWRADNMDSNVNFSTVEIEQLSQVKDIEKWMGIMYSEKMAHDIHPYGMNEEIAFPVVGVNNTKEYHMFSMQGIELKEGKNITDENCDEDIILISDKLAQKNKLSVGDTVTLSSSELDYGVVGMRETTLKIIGIFSYPEEDLNVRIPIQSKANLFFVPTKVLADNLYMGDSYFQLQICMKDAKSVSGFIDGLDKIFPDTEDEVGQYFCEYVWEENWYDEIVKPYKQLALISKILIVIIAVGSVICVYLVGSIWLRNDGKEAEILIGLGEKKRTIIGQFILEEIIPFFIGGVLACIMLFGGYREIIPKINNYYREEREEINEELTVIKSNGQIETLEKEIFEPDLHNIRFTEIHMGNAEIGEMIFIIVAIAGAFILVRGGQLCHFLNE